MKVERGIYFGPDTGSGNAIPREALSGIDRPTAEFLLNDNASPVADANRARWEAARREGRLTLVQACSDSRTLIFDQNEAVVIRYIGGAIPVQPYTKLINHRSIGGVMVMAHFDGNLVSPGKSPSGCGGLKEKERQINGGTIEATEGIEHFVENHIATSDTILQACILAGATAEHTEKPVLAAAQDHLDGTVYPIAVFTNHGRRVITAIPARLLYSTQHDPKEIYTEGIPYLDDGELPDELFSCLEQNRAQVAELKRKFPNLRKIQTTQNPSMLVLTTDIRPVAMRYPSLNVPGKVFCLSVPRDKSEIDSTVQISREALVAGVNQADFPIGMALANQGDLTKTFSQLNTFFVETRNFEKSRWAAEQLTKKEWMKKWIAIPGNKILVGETQAGIASRIEVFANL